MTRKEAIKEIKDIVDSWQENYAEEVIMATEEIQALNMAIKALEQEPKETWSIKDVATTFERHGLMTEQEPCEDTISRQAAIEALQGRK